MATLRAEAVRVRVPASSANVGSAFDCAGLGLDLWDEITAQVSTQRGMRVAVSGVGAETLPSDCTHLVARAMKIGFDALGVHPSGVDITCVNRIPHGQGLGSSAAAIIAGIVAARALVPEGESLLSDDDLLTVALELESHPDNLAGSLFGGFNIAWVREDGRAEHCTVSVHPDIAITMCLPNTITPTAEARAVLPADVPLHDAVINIGASALLLHAITAAPSLLFAATRDAIHQPRRRTCFPESLALMTTLRSAGLPAVISGAGPAVMVFATPDVVAPIVASPDWQVQSMAIAQRGAQVLAEPTDLGQG